MYLSPEDKAIGRENFNAAVGSKPLRREFLKKAFKDDLRSGKGLGPKYFGYGDSVSEPVRVGVIGAGDEGNVLIGAINPKFIAVKSIADIRPYNIWRAFHGDHYSETALKVRPGLMSVFGWKNETEAKKNVKVYGAYEELIAGAKQDGVEAVIIALPLHLHAPAAIAAMRTGLHVMTEKLMAHSVHECKEMARVAKQTDLLLATGHQRHYNILYDDAVDMIRKGLLGELHYIRAQWHRGNLPGLDEFHQGKDSWQPPMPKAAKPDDPQADALDLNLKSWSAELEQYKRDKDKRRLVSKWEKKVAQVRAQIEDIVDAKAFGYRDMEIKDASGKVVYRRPAIEELIRWRLWNRTGGGLMAELGSHQLDAASIFIAAAHDGHKQYPLSVSGAAGRPLFPPDREVEDHVYCVVEYPAPGYDPADPNNAKKKIGVQYASINGNGFGGYGETVFGTEGTLLLETEKDALLYRTHSTDGKTKVVVAKGGSRKGLPTLQINDGGDPESEAIGTLGTLPAERGYTEELEHWAWCIRNRAPENLPRCHPKLALGDAVVALVTNIAAREGKRIVFRKEWFDPDGDETPEGVKPDVKRYNV
ncbi:MAG: Gfo/Idh/MocA family oxidoreductase [Planctomycetes bacterium]|nr:Gfo/Idh/MocA family oxidoreductase [Planctomycetota bacterium]